MRTTRHKGTGKKEIEKKRSFYSPFYQEFQVFQLILWILLPLNQMVIQYKYKLVMNVLLDYMFERFVLDYLKLIPNQVLFVVD